jgi:hypothetical protein
MLEKRHRRSGKPPMPALSAVRYLASAALGGHLVAASALALKCEPNDAVYACGFAATAFYTSMR